MDSVAAVPGIADAFVHLSGFLFVLIVLSALWLIVEAIGLRFRNLDRKKSAAVASQTPPAQTSTAVKQNDAVEESELVAIMAAATLMLGAQHRVISVQNAGTRWGLEGRRQHVHSHTFPTMHKAVMARA